MSSKYQTTVNLTEKAQIVKEDLAPIFDLKNILSASLVLFGKLSDSQQKLAIAGSNNTHSEKNTKDPGQKLSEAIVTIKDMLDVEKHQPGTIFRVLSAEEQKIIDDLKKAVAPNPKTPKKKAKGG